MEIYLTDPTDPQTPHRMRFPMLPEKINVQTGAIFQSYTILGIGDIELPAGAELTGFSWKGILPGETRKDDPYLTEWSSPQDIQVLWSIYRANKTKLHLEVTDTPINHDVYIQRYSVEYSGGYGDFSYTINFIQAKDLRVCVSGAGTAENVPKGQARPSPPPAKTYTVVKGDSLWAVAQKMMGAGSKYEQLYKANRDVIDPKNKYYKTLKHTIYPGQVLTIPR